MEPLLRAEHLTIIMLACIVIFIAVTEYYEKYLTKDSKGITPIGTSSVGGQVQSIRKKSKKRKGPSDKISQPLMRIAAVLDRMVQTLEEKSLSISRKEDMQDASRKSIMTEMLKLEGIDRDSRIRAITLLNSNEAYGKLFMELPIDMRLDWIMSILNG